MFGTLVIQLPCNYTGGSIVVHHQNEKKEFNFGGSDALGNFYYVAFYADCLHEVKPVTDGYRLCLIYNLIWKGSPNDAPTPPDHQFVINKINLILKEWEKDTESPDSPEMMASLLEHQYSSSSLSFDFLKGIDKSVAAALIVAKSGLHFDLFFVQVNVSQTWSTNQACVGCEHCCYDNNTYEDDDSDIYQEIDIIDEEVSLTYLISSDGWKIKLNGFSIGEKRFFPVLDVSSLEPDDLQGCTGNQGCSVDKLYHLAAFILLPSRNHKCLFGSIVPRVLMELHKSRTLSQDFKGKLRQLQHSGLSQVIHKKTVVLLFQALHSIGKTELMTELLNDTLLHERNGGRVNFFGSKIGWSPLNLPLQTQLRNYSSSDNIQFLYCIIGTAPADDKKTVCCALLYSTLTQLLDEADSKPLQSKDTVCKLFKCLDTLEVTDRLPQLVTKLSTCSTRYPLLDTLVPAIIDLYNTLTHPDIQQCIKELTAHCISVVADSLSEPASPPHVFYSMPISCSCTDCSTLSSFLINPNKDEHCFSLPREKRKHIQDQLNSCPAIKCITESTGRPYTLIVTKTSDSIHNLHQRAFKSIQRALTALQPSDDAPPPQKLN